MLLATHLLDQKITYSLQISMRVTLSRALIATTAIVEGSSAILDYYWFILSVMLPVSLIFQNTSSLIQLIPSGDHLAVFLISQLLR